MSQPGTSVEGIDVTVPNVARMYDYYLGGTNHFEADQIAAEDVVRRFPMVVHAAHANRLFLRRAVRYMTALGIRQFLDVGTGLPTQGAVHEIAAPDARVVYVDNDPIVTTHARALLADPERITVIEGDIRTPDEIIGHPKTDAFIDWSQPVGVLLLAILHFLPDSDDPQGIVRAFTDKMPPGSHLALSHATWDGVDASDEDIQRAIEVYRRSSADSAVRSRAGVTGLLGDLELVPPGVVWLDEWFQPDDLAVIVEENPERSMAYCAVGRKA